MKSLLTILFALMITASASACQGTCCPAQEVVRVRIVHRPVAYRARRVVRRAVTLPIRATGRVLHSICPTCPR